MPSAASSDLLEYFKLETQISGESTIETKYLIRARQGRRIGRAEKRWSRQRRLGFGVCGDVWLEKDQYGSERATKEVQKARHPQLDYHREILAMAELSRYSELDLFVYFYGWYETVDSIYLAMEYFPLGDLHRCISTSDACSEDEAKLIALQLLEGLDIMHRAGFTHRDLKPQNIFVRRRSPEWSVRIADFGISKRIKPTDATALRTEIGTPNYRAPEISGIVDGTGDEYTNAVDIWSLGCVLFWILTKEVPFSLSELYEIVKGFGIFPGDKLRIRDVTQIGIEFIEALISPNPKNRPTAILALEHPWFAESLLSTVTVTPMDAVLGAKAGGSNLRSVSANINHDGSQFIFEGRGPVPKLSDLSINNNSNISALGTFEAIDRTLAEAPSPLPGSSITKVREASSDAQPRPWSRPGVDSTKRDSPPAFVKRSKKHYLKAQHTIKEITSDTEAAFTSCRTKADVKSFFRVGRVFALSWRGCLTVDPILLHPRNDADAELASNYLWRLVVVKKSLVSCHCLPILTYGGLGASKFGVDPSTHAIIYRTGTRPMSGSYEVGITKEPLEVTTATGLRLDPMSRINFEKTYEVQYIAKVLNLGMIAPKSMSNFRLSAGLSEEGRSLSQADGTGLSPKGLKRYAYQRRKEERASR